MNLKTLSFWLLNSLIFLVVGYTLRGTTQPNISHLTPEQSITTAKVDEEDKDIELSKPIPAQAQRSEKKETRPFSEQKSNVNTQSTNEYDDIEGADFKLDEIVSNEGGRTIFDSSLIESLNLSQTREHIIQLSGQIHDPESHTIMDNISLGLIEDLEKYEDIRLDTTSCSDQICGIIISSSAKNDLNSFLDQVTAKPYIKGRLRGGSLKVIEKSGEYYGVLIGAISNTPITIR